MIVKISEMKQMLSRILEGGRSPFSIMMWGGIGIGKSSIVGQVAEEKGLKLIDVRLSQIAPTDLRGLPAIDIGKKEMEWVPPKFLPRDGSGILFLDEFNMCTGVMMGIAQQLILDRCVGDYVLPDGWTIIASGNRVSDRAAINVMPAPVANRFIHFHVEPSLDDFKTVAYATFPSKGISEETITKVIGFLNFKPELLHESKLGKNSLEFPTPRSWENAMRLMDMDIDPSSAIGQPTALQLKAYISLFSNIPNLDDIISNGASSSQSLPTKIEPSIIFATISGLIGRCSSSPHFIKALEWILSQPDSITKDFVGLFVSEALIKLKSHRKTLSDFVRSLTTNTTTSQFISDYRELIS